MGDGQAVRGIVSGSTGAVGETAAVKKELSCKAKLSIYQSVDVPTLTNVHELWLVTERMRSCMQADMGHLIGMLPLRGVLGMSIWAKSLG